MSSLTFRVRARYLIACPLSGDAYTGVQTYLFSIFQLVAFLYIYIFYSYFISFLFYFWSFFIPPTVFLIVCHRASIQTTRIPHHTNTLPCPRCANIVLFRYRQFSHPLSVLTMIPVPLGVIGANFCAIRLLLCGRHRLASSKVSGILEQAGSACAKHQGTTQPVPVDFAVLFVPLTTFSLCSVS